MDDILKEIHVLEDKFYSGGITKDSYFTAGAFRTAVG